MATEEWELRPVSLYAETKVAAELDILAANRAGFSTTCLRFATVYGVSPRMRFDLTVNEFARDALLSGELVVYGEQFWRPMSMWATRLARSWPFSPPGPTTWPAKCSTWGPRSELPEAGSRRTAPRAPARDSVEFVCSERGSPRLSRVLQKIQNRLGYATARTVLQGIDEVLALLGSGAIADPFAPVYRN